MSTPGLALRIDDAAVSRLTEEFAATGRVRISDALDPAAAHNLYDDLLASNHWARTFRQGKAVREITPEQLAVLKPQQLAALEVFARAGAEDAFRFLYDAIRTPFEASERVRRGLMTDRLNEALAAPAQLDLLRRITGDSAIVRLSLDATRYLPGHFLTRHSDGISDGHRVVAMVLNLSPHWLADWGGLLQFHDEAGDISRALTPTFNTLHLFAVPQWHSVSMVTPLAPAPRISLAGWLYRD